jgi:hypothetical protein
LIFSISGSRPSLPKSRHQKPNRCRNVAGELGKQSRWLAKSVIAIQFIKGGFSFRLKSSFEVWERGHFDKRVPDRQAYEACVTYIHRNPVAARLAESEREYPFSSSAKVEEFDPMPQWFR